MVAAYELLPTADPERTVEVAEPPSLVHRIQSLSFDGFHRTIYAHADALNTTWLSELERLGSSGFACFMVLRICLLSLAIFWGFLLVSPLWCISLVSNERFLPVALQTGLIITAVIIIEPLPFVVLMSDARSKVFYVLYSVYLLVGWREVCVYLLPDESLGWFVSRQWVRDLIFTLASAAVLGCGALGWTIWQGWPRQLWTSFTVVSLLFLQTIRLKLRKDN